MNLFHDEEALCLERFDEELESIRFPQIISNLSLTGWVCYQHNIGTLYHHWPYMLSFFWYRSGLKISDNMGFKSENYLRIWSWEEYKMLKFIHSHLVVVRIWHELGSLIWIAMSNKMCLTSRTSKHYVWIKVTWNGLI